MTPKEIRRSACGMTRNERIQFADSLVKRARFLADGQSSAWQLSEFGVEAYCGWLATAADHYRGAGLGLLAELILQVLSKEPGFAWDHFDHAKATAEI